MSEQVLNVMKIMLLAGLYLFFVRVLWAVYNEMRDPRTRLTRQPEPVPPVHDPMRSSATGPAPSMTTSATTRGGSGAVAAPVIVGQLTVIEPAPMAGLTWALANEVTIGRAATCGIHLDDTYVSAVHARLFNVNGQFLLEDLESRNGTLLNGQELPATTTLLPGDLIQIGSTLMEFA